jgi:hypothetical protein
MIAGLEDAVRKLAGATGSCSVSMQRVATGAELWTVHAHAQGVSMQGQGTDLTLAIRAMRITGPSRRARAA